MRLMVLVLLWAGLGLAPLLGCSGVRLVAAPVLLLGRETFLLVAAGCVACRAAGRFGAVPQGSGTGRCGGELSKAPVLALPQGSFSPCHQQPPSLCPASTGAGVALCPGWAGDSPVLFPPWGSCLFWAPPETQLAWFSFIWCLSVGLGSTVFAVSCFGWFSFSCSLALSLAITFSKMRSAACGSPGPAPRRGGRGRELCQVGRRVGVAHPQPRCCSVVSA